MRTQKKKRLMQKLLPSKGQKAPQNGLILLEKHVQDVPQSPYVPVVSMQQNPGAQTRLVHYDNGA